MAQQLTVFDEALARDIKEMWLQWQDRGRKFEKAGPRPAGNAQAPAPIVQKVRVTSASQDAYLGYPCVVQTITWNGSAWAWSDVGTAARAITPKGAAIPLGTYEARLMTVAPDGVLVYVVDDALTILNAYSPLNFVTCVSTVVNGGSGVDTDATTTTVQFQTLNVPMAFLPQNPATPSQFCETNPICCDFPVTAAAACCGSVPSQLCLTDANGNMGLLTWNGSSGWTGEIGNNDYTLACIDGTKPGNITASGCCGATDVPSIFSCLLHLTAGACTVFDQFVPLTWNGSLSGPVWGWSGTVGKYLVAAEISCAAGTWFGTVGISWAPTVIGEPQCGRSLTLPATAQSSCSPLAISFAATSFGSVSGGPDCGTDCIGGPLTITATIAGLNNAWVLTTNGNYSQLPSVSVTCSPFSATFGGITISSNLTGCSGGFGGGGDESAEPCCPSVPATLCLTGTDGSAETLTFESVEWDSADGEWNLGCQTAGGAATWNWALPNSYASGTVNTGCCTGLPLCFNCQIASGGISVTLNYTGAGSTWSGMASNGHNFTLVCSGTTWTLTDTTASSSGTLTSGHYSCTSPYNWAFTVDAQTFTVTPVSRPVGRSTSFTCGPPFSVTFSFDGITFTVQACP